MKTFNDSADLTRHILEYDGSYTVLDLGGAAYPLRRANIVIDTRPYDARNILKGYDLLPERFSRENWIVSDLCNPQWAKKFSDKSIDVVFCGHTLEDVHCPMYVISEMSRIGKICAITSPYWEHEFVTDYSHHRWFVNPIRDRIEFVWKPWWFKKIEYPYRKKEYAIEWSGEMPRQEIFYEGKEDIDTFVKWMEELWTV